MVHCVPELALRLPVLPDVLRRAPNPDRNRVVRVEFAKHRGTF